MREVRLNDFRSWPEAAVNEGAERVRSARQFRPPTRSAMRSASSSSRPEYRAVRPIFMLPNNRSALTISDGSSPGEIASKFLKFYWVPLPGMATGKDMSKRAKRGKAETFALPMAGRVAIGAVAVAAVGYSLLSRPVSVQPNRKPSAPQAQASSTPVYVATPVHVSPGSGSIPVLLRFLPRRLWSNHQRLLTVPEHWFGRWSTTPAAKRQAP